MPAATTGLAPLPDVGTLAYNGVTFSCLQHTSISGKQLPDNAGRTIKGVEYTLVVDGIVTLEAGQTTIDTTVQTLRRLLSAQGGILTYSNKGFGPSFTVNTPGGIKDMAWGPIPEILAFQPLGASRSAVIKWSVKFTIAEVNPEIGPLVQFTNEQVITYDEDCYSAISIKGAMEIPLTRNSQTSGVVRNTVDNFRSQFLGLGVGSGIDLKRFRVTRRNFAISADKRTMTWDFLAEELPPMGLPPYATSARGRFTCNPTKQGAGLIQWLCTLNITYTIAPGFARRMAWLHFITMLQFRMGQSANGLIPSLTPSPPPAPAMPSVLDVAGTAVGVPSLSTVVAAIRAINAARAAANMQKAILMDFGIEEGLHLDSKSITFRASWQIFTDFRAILLATGIWRDAGTNGGNAWAMSVRNIQGWKGNLANSLDPGADAIVDLGLGAP